MNLFDFKTLGSSEQEQWVLREGSFIGIRQEPEFIIRLYQLDSFYVELFYHQVKKNAISIQCFTNTDKLDPYLSGMDLGFINC